MKWKGRQASVNVQDRRGSRAGIGAVGGGIGGVGLLLVLLIGLFTGQDVTPILEGATDSAAPVPGGPVELTAAEEEAGEFAAVTLADTETVWTRIFERELGQTYTPPVMVLFSGVTSSACGQASAATGPFYCPPERMVYLDTDFFVTLDRELGAGGDFAAAYVIAHEVGHHVQNELGILDQVDRIRARSDTVRSNALSVRIELQADCLAGVWARHAQKVLGTLETGDIAEAMNAASRIGDDTLMRNAGQVVRPDSFTHGTSEQRQRWFMQGYNAARIAACDTFSATTL